MSKKRLLYLILVLFVGVPLLWFLFLRGIFQRVSTVSYPNSNVGEPVFIDDELSERRIIPVEPPYIGGEEDFTPDVDRTIIKTATLSMLVGDVRKTVESATSIASEFGGAVTESSINEDINRKGVVSAQMTLRVPVDQLETALGKLKDLADKVIDETVTTRDETEQKIDLEAQIKNLEATEEQLLAIMKKATTVEETLSVQRELSMVRGNIERLQARLENLGGAAEMSTIYLLFSTEESELPLVDPDERGLLQEIKIAVRQTFNLYRQLFVAAVKGIIFILPVLIVLAAFYFIVRRKK